MSGSLAFGLAGSLANVLLRPRRALGVIIPQVTIEEIGTDTLAITDHPVEVGAPITDHAFKMPAEVRLHYGWTNASLASLLSPTSLLQEGFVAQVYDALLRLQEAREPFTLVTGKRRYPNMLLASVTQTTDERREYALDVYAICRQVIITQTQAARLPPRAAQAEPQNTAATEPSGVRQAVEPGNEGRNQSVLNLLGALRGGV